jgi:predicted nucleotidyltransferase
LPRRSDRGTVHDMTDYRTAIVRRHAQEQARRREEMVAEAQRLAAVAAASFPVERVYLFGSVAKARPISVWSDIDLAVEGVPGDMIWRLTAALAAQTRYALDVRRVEDLDAALAQRVVREGVVLYARE